jgi:hypothetical protein
LKQVDLEPREHSSSYELKPMSRWLLIPPAAMLALGIWLNGVGKVETWSLVLFGGLFFSLLPMVFPRQLLKRPRD